MRGTVSLEAFKFYDVLTINYVQGRWKWTDGTDVDYTHWLPRRPLHQGTSNNCMILGEKGWIDQPCTVATSAVCKMQQAMQ
jgi:hypothetical protein